MELQSSSLKELLSKLTSTNAPPPLPHSFQRFASFVTDSGNECKCGRMKWILQRISKDFLKICLNLYRWRQGVLKQGGSRADLLRRLHLCNLHSIVASSSNQRARSVDPSEAEEGFEQFFQRRHQLARLSTPASLCQSIKKNCITCSVLCW